MARSGPFARKGRAENPCFYPSNSSLGGHRFGRTSQKKKALDPKTAFPADVPQRLA